MHGETIKVIKDYLNIFTVIAGRQYYAVQAFSSFKFLEVTFPVVL